MKHLVATLTFMAIASAGHAQETRLGLPVANAIAAKALPSLGKAAVVIGRDGQDARRRCSNENPNIEYRDCVNASTRDPNAKVRLG